MSVSVFSIQRMKYCIEKQVDSVDYGGFPFLVDFSGSIVVAAGETDLNWSLETYVNTSTGGTTNGDLYLTQLTVEEQ